MNKFKLFLWRLTVNSSYFIKIIFDFAISISLLSLFLPIFFLTAFAILLDSPGPIFFRQTRVGRKGRLFTLYKFRSMIVDAESLKKGISDGKTFEDNVTFKMKNDPRVTRVGRFIRRYSIDELPQLFNVVKGEMSLVGPRPPVPEEVEKYSQGDSGRLLVKPGITCLWQISGRSELTFKQQVELDKQYIDSQSILLDIKILLKTIPAVLTGKGAY
ncbi:MAG: exopolysaccharide biosynthesis polyprenyl glycosylphosphotransferase [Lentisphaerota bacterium]